MPCSALLRVAMCGSTILTIFGVGLVLEQQHAFHRQIGRIDLQDIAGIDHRLVFVVHLARDGVEIALVGRIVRVEHRRRDDARRRLGEEHFGERRLDGRGRCFLKRASSVLIASLS